MYTTCVYGICIVAHFTTLLGDSAYPPRTELPDDEQKQRKEEERKGNKRWARSFLPLHSLIYLLSVFLSPSLTHNHNRPCSFLSTKTHTHSVTFASLNSLMYMCVLVCVGLLSLFPLPAKKNFYHKK